MVFKKKICILGSTGSVGKNALEVVENFQENFCIKALACFSDIDLLEKQIEKFQPEVVAVFDQEKAEELKKRLSAKSCKKISVERGLEGFCLVASLSSLDLVLVALRGSLALAPLISAIQSQKEIALATKETLVAAGDLVMNLCKKHQVKILPVDSEHNAIFQILENKPLEKVEKMILTASGGPFFFYSEKEKENITVEKALAHPTYKMGKKISIDSSTLMNKGFEVIEAHHLFGIELEKIEVVVHPESIIHGMVEFCDHNVMAELSFPDMKLPIQHALFYPERIKNEKMKKFDFFSKNFSSLTFYSPKGKDFICLDLAYQAAKEKKSYPCFLNAANEVLVDRFLNQEISWQEIGKKLEKLISSHRASDMVHWQDIFEIETEAKIKAKAI